MPLLVALAGCGPKGTAILVKVNVDSADVGTLDGQVDELVFHIGVGPPGGQGPFVLDHPASGTRAQVSSRRLARNPYRLLMYEDGDPVLEAVVVVVLGYRAGNVVAWGSFVNPTFQEFQRGQILLRTVALRDVQRDPPPFQITSTGCFLSHGGAIWIHAPGDQDCDDFRPPADCDDGDPAVHPGAAEVCDGVDNDCDGQIDFAGCSLPRCGDGAVDAGEECDLGTANSDVLPGQCPDECRTDCVCPACGDGVVDTVRGEECDDGGLEAGDGCDASCLVESISTCGDGVWDIDMGEECDDGGLVAGDGCSPTCQLEVVGQSCGDGQVTPPLEKCDDGNTMGGDTCGPTCNFTNLVTTLATGVPAQAVAVDDTWLWLGRCEPVASPVSCEIQRIHIDHCLANGGADCLPVTVAGGPCGAPADGQGTAAVLACPSALATDGNTLWFANQHTLRTLDPVTFDVATVAGRPDSCAAVDGVGSGALFHDMRALTYYGGMVYLLDGCENVLRRYDPGTHAVTTLAGTRDPDPSVIQTPPYTCAANFTCASPASQDGYGLAAVFGSPRYMASDGAGTLYVVDTNGAALRTYQLATDWVGTLVGGLGYQDGQGTAVRLQRPRGVISDGTSLFWGEQNAHTLRQVILQTSEASTMIGVRGCPGGADGQGGDGTQDWSVPGCANAPAGLAQVDTPMGAMVYHFPSRSIFLLEGGRLRRIE